MIRVFNSLILPSTTLGFVCCVRGYCARVRTYRGTFSCVSKSVRCDGARSLLVAVPFLLEIGRRSQHKWSVFDQARHQEGEQQSEVRSGAA